VCLAILLFNNNTYAQATEIHTDRYAKVYTFTEDWKEVYTVQGFPFTTMAIVHMKSLVALLRKSIKKNGQTNEIFFKHRRKGALKNTPLHIINWL
jgi:hypothetical protein